MSNSKVSEYESSTDKPTNPAAGARSRGDWHADGRAIPGPRDVGRAHDLLQATQDWGHRDPPPSREPSERALDLVDAAAGGYALAVARSESGFHLALVDLSGSVAPELLCNTASQVLTYETAEEAEQDSGRLRELAAERQREQALEEAQEHGVSR